jgi:hypothetical protein
MHHRLALILPLLLAAPSACGGAPGSADDAASTSGSGGSGGGASTSGAGGSTSGAGGSTSGAGGSTSGAGGSDGATDVPASTEALFAFLKAGKYLGFAKESGIHPSTGPHFGNVRTYINPALAASLAAGNKEHPIRAAAVKELYKNGTEVIGWAVMVKTQAASMAGNGWFWYESTDTSNPAGGYAGQGLSLCTGCHSAGKDFVRTPFPLQ